MSETVTMPKFLAARGIVPGIKVDHGLVPFAPDSPEQVTEGLDGLAARLTDARALGARFAKWRALFHVGAGLPSAACIDVNAWLLGRYARICQDCGVVPIVEPEVLMTGDHGLARCADATSQALAAVFGACRRHGVDLAAVVLKPNMVTPGSARFESETPAAVARATVTVLRAGVPPEVPGIAFLSGGQTERQATANLEEISRLGPHPWQVTFSFGRALQASALAAWAGRTDSTQAAQTALLARAAENSRALLVTSGR
jgi:fructose-bisphosphate aldolase class I